MVGLLQAEAVLPHPVDCPCCSTSRTSQQVVHRQSGLLSEEQEVGCEAGRGVRRVVCLHLMFMFTDVCACEIRRRGVNKACRCACPDGIARSKVSTSDDACDDHFLISAKSETLLSRPLSASMYTNFA